MDSIWPDIAYSAAMLLDRLAATDDSPPLDPSGPNSDPGLGPHVALWSHPPWEPFQVDNADDAAFRKELKDIGCSDQIQQYVLSEYGSSAAEIISSCAGAFEATMRGLATAVTEDDHTIFERMESATRTRFTKELSNELQKLRLLLLERMRDAAQQARSIMIPRTRWSETSPLGSASTRTGVVDVEAVSVAGVFDEHITRVLFTAFNQFERLTKGERVALAKRTGLREKQVATWFANQRQRRTRRPTGPIDDAKSQLSLKEQYAEHTSTFSEPVAPSLLVLPNHTTRSTVNLPGSRQYLSAVPLPTTSPIVEPLTDFGPIFNRTLIASQDSDISGLHYQIDSSDFSVNSLDSKWSQDAPESYYGLPLPPASDMQFSFELPPTEAIEHFDYSPDNSIWNAFGSSFSSSSSSADSYLDDSTFQPPMSAEDASPLTCGLLTARQATFAESPSSFGSPPLSTPDVEMDMDADSVFGHISEFGVLTAPSDTGLASASPN